MKLLKAIQLNEKKKTKKEIMMVLFMLLHLLYVPLLPDTSLAPWRWDVFYLNRFVRNPCNRYFKFHSYHFESNMLYESSSLIWLKCTDRNIRVFISTKWHLVWRYQIWYQTFHSPSSTTTVLDWSFSFMLLHTFPTSRGKKPFTIVCFDIFQSVTRNWHFDPVAQSFLSFFFLK